MLAMGLVAAIDFIVKIGHHVVGLVVIDFVLNDANLVTRCYTNFVEKNDLMKMFSPLHSFFWPERYDRLFYTGHRVTRP